MIPQILQLGPLPINSFGLMVALGIFAAIYSLQRSFKLYELDPTKAESIVLLAGVTGIIGARLLYVLEDWQSLEGHRWEALFASAGFTFYGGFILAALIVVIKSKLQKIPLSIMAATALPAVALGYAIGRLGCQLSGDGDYGIQTKSILGMSYSTGVVPTPPGILVFPTPLYESVMCLGIAWLLFSIEKQESWRKQPLRIFGVGLFLLALERFFVEFLRINPKLLDGLSEAQLIALLLAFLGLLFIFIFKTKTLERS